MEKDEARLFWSQRRADLQKAIEYADERLAEIEQPIGQVATQSCVEEVPVRTPLIYEEVM